ncbi:MAG TPA: aspartate/glutamate racemase family protein [Halanaerobiales bacterium]|mgnify:FL=1|nr:aspartate/glutamate racemase family protein [Halanaerobiales bacterium]
MKTIGLIGGMSWESSLEYYRLVNEFTKEKLGKKHSAKCLMYSVDFAEIEKMQHEGKWELLKEKMINYAKNLKKGGADFIVICTNTMHKMADDIENEIDIPLLHIADAAAHSIIEHDLEKVALLGTKFTMERDFYKDRLKEHGIEVIIPWEEEREIVHNTIYNELIDGLILEKSKTKFKKIINNLYARGAEGVVLGCTEIPLLVKNEDSPIPVFDTTNLHAKAAVEFAIENK